MSLTLRATGAAALLLVSLAACQDQPTASAPAAEPPAAPNVLAKLSCAADVAAGTVSCAPSQEGAPAGGARYTLVTVGGQDHYVRLANSGTVVDATAGTLTTTVTVQNLLLAVQVPAPLQELALQSPIGGGEGAFGWLDLGDSARRLG